MHKRILLTAIAALLLCRAPLGMAGDGGGFVTGTATAGAHVSDGRDNPVRVGEYVNLQDYEDVMAELILDMFGGTSTTLYAMGLNYRDNATKDLAFDL